MKQDRRKRRKQLLFSAGLGVGAGALLTPKIGDRLGQAVLAGRLAKDSEAAQEFMKERQPGRVSKYLSKKVSTIPEIEKSMRQVSRTPAFLLGGSRNKEIALDSLQRRKIYLKKLPKAQSIGRRASRVLIGASVGAKTLAAVVAADKIFGKTKTASRIPVRGAKSYNRRDQVAKVTANIPRPGSTPSGPYVTGKQMKQFRSKKRRGVMGDLQNIGLGT